MIRSLSEISGAIMINVKKRWLIAIYENICPYDIKMVTDGLNKPEVYRIAC